MAIDIDIDDFSQKRTCCPAETVCCKCWILLQNSMVFLNEIFTKHFDFKDFFWFFSGRRGIHCYIKDSAIQGWKSNQRSNLIHYLELFKNFSLKTLIPNQSFDLNIYLMRPIFIQALEVFEKNFYASVPDFGSFSQRKSDPYFVQNISIFLQRELVL